MRNVPGNPVILVILDGFGINPGKTDNPVYEAYTPNLDICYSHYPHTSLQASGLAVGLPDGQMGNSEVGHLTLGCGSIVRQDLVKINDAIESGKFQKNPVLIQAATNARSKNRPLHLVGLVSDGGIHSHIDHLLALIRLCALHEVKPVLHMITDGRDTAPRSALRYLERVLPALQQAGGHIASIMGRFYAMDRDHRWERTELAWRALVLGKGRKINTPQAAIETAYANEESDEFIRPVLIAGADTIQENDELLFFNFRKDRPRQLVEALGIGSFKGFDRGEYRPVNITCLMPYNKAFELPYAFEPEKPHITLGQVISENGLKQFHCAETEKYAHVTYFFNGQRAEPYSGESQLLIPSPKVSTYDQKPEMSAVQVTDAVISAMRSYQYGFIVVNFANGDMVGHSARKDAVIQAVETLDREVGRIVAAAREIEYSVIITADHGNCEEMHDPATNSPHTQHTPNPVPCLVIDSKTWQLSCGGGLANIAPTVLHLMGIKIPAEMTARSLLLREIEHQEPQTPYIGVA